MSDSCMHKRFGDIATFSRGLTFAKGDVAEDSSKRVLRSNNIDLQSHSLIFDEIAYLKEDFVIPNEKKLHKGDLFICMSNGSTQHLGKVAYVEEDMDYAFGGFMGAIHPNKDIAFPKYAYYACLSFEYRRFLASIFNGVNINNLKWSDLSNFEIPMPSLDEQMHIVAGLDLLTGIIDKQKQQLKELDTLAQSIFYDMFGNPVENEKGWHCMNLREIASFKNGLNYTNKKSGRLVKVLGVSDFQNRSFVDSSEIGCVHIDDCFDDDYYLNDDDIVFVRSNGSKALIGRSVRVLTQGENITYSGYCIRCRITSPLIISPYLAAFVKTEQIHNVLTTGGRGCNIQNLNQTTLGDLIIPIPPLAIQNSFTKKIQSIKSQKESINCSIAESQKLFDYTMDKYFG